MNELRTYMHKPVIPPNTNFQISEDKRLLKIITETAINRVANTILNESLICLNAPKLKNFPGKYAFIK